MVRTHGVAVPLADGSGWWGPPVQVEDRVIVAAERFGVPMDAAHLRPGPVLEVLRGGSWAAVPSVGSNAVSGDDGRVGYLLQFACPREPEPEAFRLSFLQPIAPA